MNGGAFAFSLLLVLLRSLENGALANLSLAVSLPVQHSSIGKARAPLVTVDDLDKSGHGIKRKGSVVQACTSATGVRSMLLSALKTNAHLVRDHANKSVVFVGSSWSLHGKGLGQLIDSFDIVVRMNSAPVLGFEHDVGKKTTHRCLSSLQGACWGDRACTLEHSNRFWRLNAGVKILPMFPSNVINLLRGLHVNPKMAPLLSEPIDCMRACPKVVTLWLAEAAKRVPGLRPRTLSALGLRAGFCCLFAFVSAGFAPAVAGFDLSCTPNVGPEYYYEPSGLNMCGRISGSTKIGHDYVTETAILRDMVGAGLVTMLT